jgi:alpha-L-fucosidase
MGGDNKAYTAHDLRFTTKAGALYAIVLGWPEDGKLTIRSLWRGTPYLSGPVRQVQLLGSPDAIGWQQSADGLVLDLPAAKPNDLAYVVKILAARKPTSVHPGR